MGVKKLDFIGSIDALNHATIEFKQVESGSVKVIIKAAEQEVTVTRNQLIEKIEELSKKALSNSSSAEVAQFKELKKKINDSEQIQVKGAFASIRRFFGNLLKKNRQDRLDKIERDLAAIPEPVKPSLHQSTSDSASHAEEESSSSLSVEVEDSNESQSEEESSSSSSAEVESSLETKARSLGLTQEEIEELKVGNHLEDIVSQLERSRQPDVQTYFGTSDLEVLKRLFIQNATQEKSRFEVEGKVFKLRKDRIYTKKVQFAKGGDSTIYKIDEICLETFKVLQVARKKIENNSPEVMKHEYDMLHEIAEVANKGNQIHLLDAFQGAPYRIVHKDKNGVQVSYLDGPRYSGDAYDHLIDNEQKKAGPVLKAFDLMIQGIAFLQKQEIVHVDIKLENIFLESLENGEFRFRLADFGGVEHFSKINTDETALTCTAIYTPNTEVPYTYCSLENLNRLSTFQLGACLYMAFVQALPFEKTRGGFLDLSRGVIAKDLIDQKERKEIPQPAIGFILALLNPKRENRPIGDALILAWEKAKGEMPALFG